MAALTVKAELLLEIPPTATTTLPEVAPLGTGTVIVPLLQLLGVAAVPLKVTVLAPCAPPKLLPAIVTTAPTGPEDGEMLVIVGATAKLTALLASPPTVTTTLPLVAVPGTGTTILVSLQLAGVAAAPLNVIVLVPWVAPKSVPVI